MTILPVFLPMAVAALDCVSRGPSSAEPTTHVRICRGFKARSRQLPARILGTPSCTAGSAPEADVRFKSDERKLLFYTPGEPWRQPLMSAAAMGRVMAVSGTKFFNSGWVLLR